MKLFVKSKSNNGKIYLSINASSRKELAQILGSPYFNLNGHSYNVNEVYAESSTKSTTTGAVVGGIIGLVGGPIGLLIGGVAGGFLGNQEDQTELSKVRNFNMEHTFQFQYN